MLQDGKRVVDNRSAEVVDYDRWDRRTFDYIRAEIDALPAATENLLEITKTARPQMADVFNAFHKVEPELLGPSEVRDDHQVNLNVTQEMMDLPEYTELRRFTRGDKVAAAMAAVKIEPELEILHDRQKKLQEQFEELQKLRDKLREKLQEQLQNNPPKVKQPGEQPEGDGPEEEGDQPGGEPGGDQPGETPSGPGTDPGSGQGQGEGQGPQSVQDEIDALKAMIEALENGLEIEVTQTQGSTRAALQDALSQAVDDARDEQTAARAFGQDPGKLTRLPAKDRLELAKKLNNQRMRDIAERFGALWNVAMSPRQRKVPQIPHEIMGVTMGSDLEHILMEQLALLDDEDMQWPFLADYADGRLLQMKLRGTESVGRGGIILCEDGSGSMHGHREMWAKAVMLVLLNIAKRDNREFHLLHFGSRSELYEMSFTRPEDFTTDRIISAAEIFCGGGTDFQRPLARSLEILKEENARTGRVSSDIVFVTDGECSVNSDWQAQWTRDMQAIDGAVWGIIIDGHPQSEPLYTLCDGYVTTVNDLGPKSGKDVKDIFKGVQTDRSQTGRQSRRRP
jgi:uncharacterized protein with von Willebrand factor type A (vWA) domain/DNA-binding transcriptional MerR regulator